MKIESRTEKRNDLLKRTEYLYIFSHPMVATPSRKELQKAIAEELGVSRKRVEIRKIYSFHGQAKSRVRVYVWDEEKVDDLSEPKEAENGEKVSEDGKEEKEGQQ